MINPIAMFWRWLSPEARRSAADIKLRAAGWVPFAPVAANRQGIDVAIEARHWAWRSDTLAWRLAPEAHAEQSSLRHVLA